MMQKIVLSSQNQHKIAEIRAVLAGIELLERPSDVAEVEENGETLEDNARLKAVALVEATGHGAVADDTGLEVDALGGAPGVHAARFAGDHVSYADNVNKMLRELEGVPEEKRTARFVTIALLRYPDGRELIAEGEVRGRIATEPRSSLQEGTGWGYDPIFIPEDGDGRAFSEMTSEEKQAISHRGRAFRKLRELL